MTLPSGVVTFLFTDVVGSSTKWDMAGDVMEGAIRRHDEIIDKAISSQSGEVVKKTGDGFMAVFANPTEAVSAAVESQRTLGAEAWEAAIADFAVRALQAAAVHTVVSRLYPAAAPHRLGRADEAGLALANAQQDVPEITIAMLEQIEAYRDPAGQAHLSEPLRSLGLPES